MSLEYKKLLPPRWFSRREIWSGKVRAFVVRTRIPWTVFEVEYTVRSDELGQHGRIPGLQHPQRDSEEHRMWHIDRYGPGKWRTAYSYWLGKLDRFWGGPVLELFLCVCEAQFRLVPDSRIGSESSVVDKSQDCAPTSPATLGTISPYIVKLFSDCCSLLINLSL